MNISEKETNANLVFRLQTEKVIDTVDSEALIKMRKVFIIQGLVHLQFGIYWGLETALVH